MLRPSGFLFSLIFLSACASEWGSKLRTSSEVYPPVAAEYVEILFGPPARPYKQIGIVSVLGSTWSSDVAMLAKLRKAAADLGADAVVVTRQYENAGGAFNAVSTKVGTTTITSGGGLFSYPKNQGIAIKYE